MRVATERALLQAKIFDFGEAVRTTCITVNDGKRIARPLQMGGTTEGTDDKEQEKELCGQANLEYSPDGTWLYQPPDRLVGGRRLPKKTFNAHAVDVFAVALVAYELLTPSTAPDGDDAKGVTELAWPGAGKTLCVALAGRLAGFLKSKLDDLSQWGVSKSELNEWIRTGEQEWSKRDLIMMRTQLIKTLQEQKVPKNEWNTPKARYDAGLSKALTHLQATLASHKPQKVDAAWWNSKMANVVELLKSMLAFVKHGVRRRVAENGLRV